MITDSCTVCTERPLNELMNIYIPYRSHSHKHIKLKDNVCVSSNVYLTLNEFMLACKEHCKLHHSHSLYTERNGLINTAKLVTDHGFYSRLQIFPGVSYSSATAKRKLLQMPLAAITLGEPTS